MRVNHKLLGLMVGGTMFGLLATSGIGSAGLIPDTYFSPLATTSVTVKGGCVSSGTNKNTGDCSAANKTTNDSTSTASVTFQGTFTEYVPLSKGVACTDADAADNNFLDSGGSAFFISVGPGGIVIAPAGTPQGPTGPGNCIPAEDTGVGFTFTWAKSTSTKAVATGDASWVATNGDSGTAPVSGTMTLVEGSPTSTLGNDCGTWQMSVTISDLPISLLAELDLDTNNTTVNVQMDYGQWVNTPNEGSNFSAGCMVLPLTVSSGS